MAYTSQSLMLLFVRMAKLRMWLMEFLGILGLEKAQQLRHAEVMRYAAEAVGNASNRAEQRHSEVIELLIRLEQHFTAQHVGTRPASPPVYDWEQVQMQELVKMIENQPKEEN